MNIAQWLYASAQRYPHNPALLVGETVMADYAEFARRASIIAASLSTRYGIECGDRIGVFMKNRTDYLEVLYAIWWAGAVAVPINAKLHGKEAAWILNDAEVSLVIIADDIGRGLDVPETDLTLGIKILSVDSTEFQVMRQQTCQAPGQAEPIPQLEPTPHSDTHPAPRDSDDLAWLFYTSGTTGNPKGVMLSHANLVAMSLCYPIDVDAVSSEDAALYAAPMSHGAGLYNFIHVRYGARHVVPVSGGFDEHEILDLAKTLKHVSMFAAPTMVKRLVSAAKTRGESGEGIKTIIYGGGPMYLADIEAALKQLGPRFVQIFGQGESPMTITALSKSAHSDKHLPQYREHLASVGTAHSAVQVRISNSARKALSAGEIGEVEVKGLTVMRGYWKQPEASAEALRDGWLRTGDMGALDQQGFLTLHDRAKDVIISGGSNIYPREVEEVLLAHVSVQEVCVIGKPDPDWGEIVIAFVVTEAGQALDQAALDQHCLSSIARFKRPKQYIHCEGLPKNNTGKVLKRTLRQQLGVET